MRTQKMGANGWGGGSEKMWGTRGEREVRRVGEMTRKGRSSEGGGQTHPR